MPVPPEPAARLVLEHATADWHQLVWLLVAVLLVWLAWRSYGQRPPGWRGRLLQSLRCGSVLLLVALLAAPAWLRTSTHVDPGRIAVAVDSSASMARTDGPEQTARMRQAERLRAALAASPVPEQAQLSRWQLGSELRRLDPAAPLPAPTQAASNLGPQLQELVERERPDLVVLVSDGRRTRGAALSAVGAELASSSTRVLVLQSGSAALDPELRIGAIIGPRDIPRDEQQPYSIRWRYRALDPQQPMSATIRDQTGQVLDQAQVPVEARQGVAGLEAEAQLRVTLSEPGTHDLEVEVRQGAVSDRMPLQVRVHDRRLKVLLLAQRPRWDMRYLREALSRDRTVEVHSYLYPGSWLRWGAADYGPDPALRLDAASAAEYDAIVIGDMPGIAFAPAVQDAIAEAVRQHGLGLIWLPGRSGNLATIQDGPLAALVPMRVPERAAITAGYADGTPFRVRRSDTARRLGLLQPGERAWQELPALTGHLPIRDLADGARVLMESDVAAPLVVARDYGGGRAVVVGIDTTWLWRPGVGDRHLHRLHSQLLRWASAGRLYAEQPWRIGATPFQLHPGTRMQLSVAPAGAVDQALVLPEAVTLRLAGPDGAERLIRLPRRGEDQLFASEVPAPGLGSWRLSVADGLDPGSVQGIDISVAPPDEEARDPRADPAALQALAEATGGSVFTEAGALVAAIPDLRRQRSTASRQRLWDAPWLLLLTLTLLSGEWALRRWWRLP